MIKSLFLITSILKWHIKLSASKDITQKDYFLIFPNHQIKWVSTNGWFSVNNFNFWINFPKKISYQPINKHVISPQLCLWTSFWWGFHCFNKNIWISSTLVSIILSLMCSKSIVRLLFELRWTIWRLDILAHVKISSSRGPILNTNDSSNFKERRFFK